ncbi:MAG: hypothetical protein B6I20_06800 [Bacteroidetes bacterium 4572_117]|nr:MAG: hypothetical protein B6I20_06800 [Bacteroidetes bacterium 4572_117]
MKKFLFIVICFVGIGALINAQGTIPELEKRLKKAKGKDKFETLYQLSKAYLSVSPKKSLDYANKAYSEAKKLKDENMKANALNMIGTAYYKRNKYKSAIKNYEKELAIREKLSPKTSYLKTLFNIASVHDANKKEKKALVAYIKSLKLAKDAKYVELAYKCYEAITRLCKEQRKHKEAYEYLEEYYKYKGTINLSSDRRKIEILETKYKAGKRELDEKESELSQIDSTLSIVQSEKETLVKDTTSKGQAIDQLSTETKEQKLTIEEQKAEVKRQRQWLVAFFGFFTVILVFSILLYKQYKAKKKANDLLIMQNAEIIEKSEEIKVQAEQLQQRNTKIQKQKEVLVEQSEELLEQSRELEKHWNNALKSKAEILDSINYARKIQKAIFPSTDYVDSVLDDYFLLFKPRDIVSGDFFWIKKIDDFIIVAVADCTGHGVPGAFMSILGTSFLNEIVSHKDLDDANEILNLLRYKVKESLGQRGRARETKDGMDLALYYINTETLELQYSGAHNPLYIIRETPEEKFMILKADRQPIGVHVKEKDFTNYKFQLERGDCLYSFSDGYTDQFGGEKGRKFKTKNFQKILFTNYKKPMSEQKEILNNNFKNWIGDEFRNNLTPSTCSFAFYLL